MPSFTFVSTANAVRAARRQPVFVDIRAGHAEHRRGAIEAAITPRTKAICRSTTRASAARWTRSWRSPHAHELLVIEDAAQGTARQLRGRPLGRHRRPGGLSFHETKNIISRRGRGAARQRPALRRAGRDHPREGHQPEPVLPRPGRQVHLGRRRLLVPPRRDHRRVPVGADGGGRRDHRAAAATSGQTYHEAVRRPGARRVVRGRSIPSGCQHNAHLYYLLLPDQSRADALIERLAPAGVQPVFHYVPLHSSPFGRSMGRAVGDMTNTGGERAARPAAALARSRGPPRWGDRRGHRGRRLTRAASPRGACGLGDPQPWNAPADATLRRPGDQHVRMRGIGIDVVPNRERAGTPGDDVGRGSCRRGREGDRSLRRRHEERADDVERRIARRPAVRAHRIRSTAGRCVDRCARRSPGASGPRRTALRRVGRHRPASRPPAAPGCRLRRLSRTGTVRCQARSVGGAGRGSCPSRARPGPRTGSGRPGRETGGGPRRGGEPRRTDRPDRDRRDRRPEDDDPAEEHVEHVEIGESRAPRERAPGPRAAPPSRRTGWPGVAASRRTSSQAAGMATKAPAPSRTSSSVSRHVPVERGDTLGDAPLPPTV